MGLQKNESISYLRISAGKIRKRTTKEDPEAEERHDDINDKVLYERVYKNCVGYLREIRVQEHEEYGVNYSMVLVDAETGEKFSLSMGETTRYFQSMVMHMPNVDFSQPLEVRPYSFEKDKQRNIGIAFRQNEKKVENYYKDWDEAKERSISKNGLEKFNFAKLKGNKSEIKILQIKLLQFLKAQLAEQIVRLGEFVEANPLKAVEKEAAPPPEDSESQSDAATEEKVKAGRGRPEKKRGKGGKPKSDLSY